MNELRFKEDNKIFYYRAAAIIIEDNHVLVIKSDAADYLYSVGGAINHGETAEDAVRREVREETGVDYEIERPVFVYENIFQEDGRNLHGIEIFFLMKPRGTREGLVCKSHGMDGAKEHLHWIQLNGMNDVKLYPEFFKTRLHSLPLGIEMLKRAANDEIADKAQPEPLLKGDIHNNSKPKEKIELFLSLFTGRTDVYARRWVSKKTGKSGYSPACYNFWKPTCAKFNGTKVKCSECTARRFIPFDETAVDNHLRGNDVIGSYAMLPDETCRFLAFDFDAKNYTQEDLRRDVSAIREVCMEHDIDMAVERSRSGQGVHFWVFFAEPVNASTARKFGSSVITCAMNRHHKLPFKTYDRLIPTQDTLPKGGFGNLVALPLQKEPRQSGNSEFIDENFISYPDQWGYLSQVKQYTLQEIEQFIRRLAPTGELGQLQPSSEQEVEKPWEIKTPEIAPLLKKSDLPPVVELVTANMLYIKKEGFKNPALNALKRLAAFRNPEFYKAQAMRLSTHEKSRIIDCSEDTPHYLGMPRGLLEQVRAHMAAHDVNIIVTDETNPGRTIDVTFNGELRGEQNQAVAAMLAHDIGILSATTGFGKTVIGAYLIAERKVNALILVDKTTLLQQWLDRLGEFLVINEEPEASYTPTGRKRKQDVIGSIGGGKSRPGGIVDVALIQSLVSGDEVKDLVRKYGMVIVDECHRAAAFTCEQILKTTNARYIHGLSATPTRKDGHTPIIYMHCGKIRYKVDAKKQAEERPFEHYIIPRFTRFQKPTHHEGAWNIQSIYAALTENGARNELIAQDVLIAVEQGRNPIVLTERKEHVNRLYKLIAEKNENVFCLVGGVSQKHNRELMEKIHAIPADEPLIIVATGKYVGEGFDLPRLDTLFLAMPISWKGTVQQYAGRLHRIVEGKDEVQAYDYVDVYEPMLETMYQRRLKGYAAIGYKAKGATEPIEEIHAIFNSLNFAPVYSTDIIAAQREIVIVSPFLGHRRVEASIAQLAAANAKVTVITRPPESYPDKDTARIVACIATLTNSGIHVKTKENIHQKFAVIDQRLVWYGSINLLSYGSAEESIMRIESLSIAGELLRGLGL